MDSENYDGEDARICPFCQTTFSADSDKCLAASLDSLTAHRDQIAFLRAQLADEKRERALLGGEVLGLQASLAEAEERARKAEEESWDSTFNRQLSTARIDGARAMFEWIWENAKVEMREPRTEAEQNELSIDVAWNRWLAEKEG